MEFQGKTANKTIVNAGALSLILLWSATFIFVSSKAAEAKIPYFSDANVVEIVLVVTAINTSAFAFVQLSLSYHMLSFPHLWRGPDAMRGLRFMASYVMIAIALLAYLENYPGESETLQGRVANHYVYRCTILFVICAMLALNKVEFGSFGIPLVILLVYAGIKFGDDVFFILFLLCVSKFHQLSLRDTGYDVYFFGILAPLGVVSVTVLIWAEMTESSMCRFNLPLNVWFVTMTFPAVMVWFHVSGFLSVSFHQLFQDSFILSILHNQFGPTAIPLKYFVPLQIIIFAMNAILLSATCGALDMTERSDFIMTACYTAVGSMLFVVRYVQDNFYSEHERIV